MIETLKYVKNSEDTNDFENAVKIEKIGIGEKNLYFKKLLNWYYVPFSKIERAFRRVNECSSRVGCCSNDFSTHKLVAVIAGEELEMLIGEGLYRQEPERVMDALRTRHPEIPISVK